eukprot:gnl/TRDRNA2_/TRDRNA2_85527_c0_seq1.p1 gnl/TRDRNA2_/TRDRNA2_85527_c0~~gnl/TRDRNA2_/TRDRNA2_85527_c0_seq1.p1  ORF type:complete len:108 (+),score=8.97 gnl/TRDRNA2_/TRDRNA2_85527_c0_seq1:99-422(+)
MKMRDCVLIIGIAQALAVSPSFLSTRSSNATLSADLPNPRAEATCKDLCPSLAQTMKTNCITTCETDVHKCLIIRDSSHSDDAVAYNSRYNECARQVGSKCKDCTYR